MENMQNDHCDKIFHIFSRKFWYDLHRKLTCIFKLRDKTLILDVQLWKLKATLLYKIVSEFLTMFSIRYEDL